MPRQVLEFPWISEVPSNPQLTLVFARFGAVCEFFIFECILVLVTPGNKSQRLNSKHLHILTSALSCGQTFMILISSAWLFIPGWETLFVEENLCPISTI